MNKTLTPVKTKTISIVVIFLLIVVSSSAKKNKQSSADDQRYHSITPGATWLDTNGKPIQAHGFSVFYKDSTYYWYGENKAGRTYHLGKRGTARVSTFLLYYLQI